MHTPTVCHDGYIRLSLQALSEMPLMHLASDFDPCILSDLKLQTVPAQEAGYSEWSSLGTPTISIGWSWFVHDQTRRLLPAPETIRSNVMLVDTHGYDLGKVASSHLFNTWLNLYDWQQTVADAIGLASVQTC
jgi:hypothetical protein